jgi:hypothetical protein
LKSSVCLFHIGDEVVEGFDSRYFFRSKRFLGVYKRSFELINEVYDSFDGVLVGKVILGAGKLDK